MCHIWTRPCLTLYWDAFQTLFSLCTALSSDCQICHFLLFLFFSPWVKTNPNHVLQPYPPHKTDIPYQLRARSHSMTLINKTKFLNDNDFLVRITLTYLAVRSSSPCQDNGQQEFTCLTRLTYRTSFEPALTQLIKLNFSVIMTFLSVCYRNIRTNSTY